MQKTKFTKSLAVFGVSILLAVGIQSEASANRRVIFNETSTAIQNYFGQYWSRLTTTNATGDRLITYTYNPGAIRSLFLNANQLRMSVAFVNDRAEQIKIHQNGAGFDIRHEQFDTSDYYPSFFDDLFEYIFGYRPSSNSSVYRRLIYDDSGDGGTLHTTTFCVREGIAISYEWISTRGFINYITIFQERECI